MVVKVADTSTPWGVFCSFHSCSLLHERFSCENFVVPGSRSMMVGFSSPRRDGITFVATCSTSFLLGVDDGMTQGNSKGSVVYSSRFRFFAGFLSDAWLEASE